jgi:4-alpha-glucanotransferase
VDRLAAAGQSWWQVLPLGPTGHGHSPYQALSSFAANLLVLSPDQLLERRPARAERSRRLQFLPSVDFERSSPSGALNRAWQKFRSGARADLRPAFEQFCEEKEALLAEPALFMALRARYRGAAFSQWPEDLARREPKALEKARQELAEPIDSFRFGQFILLRHWALLKDYANRRGIRVLGDLPIFVSPDSADMWANPELFLLDDRLCPRVVAGVPPDYFSADGQLWGNPVYAWEALRKTGYRWGIDRLQAPLEYLDAIRIDHFRGFEAAWHVPAGAPTPASGQWVPGPGAFLRQGASGSGAASALTEDLGSSRRGSQPQGPVSTARHARAAVRLQRDPDNPHLPHHCVHNGVVYTGTHDNDTTCGWYEALPEHSAAIFGITCSQPADSRKRRGSLSASPVLGIRAGDRAVAGSARAGRARLNVPGARKDSGVGAVPTRH